MLQTKVSEKIDKQILCSIFFPRKSCRYEIMRKNMVSPQMTMRRMRIACWITKATNIHSEYRILLAFPRPQLLWRGPGVALWLRRCATSRTVPGSIPGGVTGFFSDIFPSDRTKALGSTQPLVKISTRNIPGGKGGWCVRLTTSPPSHAECHDIWEPKPPGTLRATPGL
jgi:hypothetical protein